MKILKYQFLKIILIIFISSCSINNAGNKNNIIKETNIIQNIPSIFRGRWSGPSGKTLGDVTRPIDSEIILPDGTIIPPNGFILSSGEIIQLTPEQIEKQNQGIVIDIDFIITEKQITQYIRNFNDLINDYEIEVNPDKEYYLYSGNNLVYIWLNKSFFYSETQVFNFQRVSEDTMFCVRTQQTSFNYVEGDVYHIENKSYRSRLPHYMRAERNYTEPGILSNKKLQNINNKVVKGQLQNYGQLISQEFQGIWVGEINYKNDTYNGKMETKFLIKNSKVELYLKYDNNNNYIKNNFIIDYHDYYGNNFIYAIIYKSGNKTTIDTYSLSLINNKEMSVIYSRNSNEIVNNHVLYFIGEGKLIRE